MEHFIVSARKYRPSTFQSVVGQKSLTTTLKNAIVGNKLAHAYLFNGPRGVGKTTCARIFAKTINCLNLTSEHEACNACESCVAFNEQRSYNIHELDAASNNSVDDIRILVDQVRIPPQIGRYKVYIIDEVHMLSQSAFNAFLKTLEEPPAHAIFILATTEKHKIIPTILSRCQVYDFNRISIADTVEHLQYVAQQEGVNAEVEALNVIAQKADGGMRDALSIFDQTVSYTGGNVTYKAVIENLNVLDYEYYFKLTDAILRGSVTEGLLILNDIFNRGFEGQHIITGITSHFRDLLVCKDPITAQLFQVGASIRERYIEMAQQCSVLFLYQAIDLANECDLNYRLSKNKRLLIELALIRLCQLSDNPVPPTDNRSKEEIKPIQPAQQSILQPAQQVVGAQAAPAPQAAVVQQPAQAIAANPTVKKSVLPSGMGFSLASVQSDKKEETEEKAVETKQVKNSKFSENELIIAWKEYAESLKEEKLVQNAMMYYLPKILSETLFEVEVNTEINEQYLTNNSLSILAFLREKLQNDDITMTIKISETQMITKPLTSREIFDEMAEKNPSLQRLSNELGLELG
jgi:DNA polymerase-3 subunit gamma/tau